MGACSRSRRCGTAPRLPVAALRSSPCVTYSPGKLAYAHAPSGAVRCSLDTKKKIVAKFGENAAFEKGKPLPAVKHSPGREAAARVVKPKPPVIRKAAAQ